MRIYKVIPRLENERILKLWHKAQEAQWSARSISWDAPQRVISKANKDRLGRVLTPILMGEQVAFHSASRLLPLLGATNESESQYYLSTWLVDEARHAELFSRMFKRLDRQPMSLRRMPGIYLFQSQVMAEDVGIWLAGLLVVEVMAKLVMTEFRRLDLDTPMSEICDGILEDEARHLGFNRLYTEDRVRKLQLEDPALAQAFETALQERLDGILEAAPLLFGALETELDEMGFRHADVLEKLGVDARKRMDKAIAAGYRAAAAGAGPVDYANAEAAGS